MQCGVDVDIDVGVDVDPRGIVDVVVVSVDVVIGFGVDVDIGVDNHDDFGLDVDAIGDPVVNVCVGLVGNVGVEFHANVNVGVVFENEVVDRVIYAH